MSTNVNSSFASGIGMYVKLTDGHMFLYQSELDSRAIIKLGCLFYFSESESTIGRGEDIKRRKTRTKRRKTVDKSPCLTVLSLEADEIECLLELPNRNAVTFKFDLEGDKPGEIAESLVSYSSTMAIIIHSCFNFCKFKAYFMRAFMRLFCMKIGSILLLHVNESYVSVS